MAKRRRKGLTPLEQVAAEVGLERDPLLTLNAASALAEHETDPTRRAMLGRIRERARSRLYVVGAVFGIVALALAFMWNRAGTQQREMRESFERAQQQRSDRMPAAPAITLDPQTLKQMGLSTASP
jgi:glutathione S-transferase